MEPVYNEDSDPNLPDTLGRFQVLRDVLQVIQDLVSLVQVLPVQRRPHLLQEDLQGSVLESVLDKVRASVSFVTVDILEKRHLGNDLGLFLDSI